MSIVATFFLILTLGLLYASVAEWTLHKRLMHSWVRWFAYPYRTHTLVHHKLYRADASYHLHGPLEDTKIPMAWWNGAALVFFGMIPLEVIAALLWHFAGRAEAITVIATGLFVSAAYYVAYERLHWCMHVPKDRWIESTRAFRALNAHHLLHHQYQWKNFNVVFPFADWLFGTLLRRALRPFNQAEGEAVPDVQPI